MESSAKRITEWIEANKIELDETIIRDLNNRFGVGEDCNQKHLRVVNQISEILIREYEDHDDIYFIMRTLRNIFCYDEIEDRTQFLFGQALDRFANTNRDWVKNHFNLKEK